MRKSFQIALIITLVFCGYALALMPPDLFSIYSRLAAVQAGGTFVAVDTFTDTNGVALEDHTPDSANFTWDVVNGTWEILANKAINTPGMDADFAPDNTCTTDVARTEVDATTGWTNPAGNPWNTFASVTETAEPNGSFSLHLVATGNGNRCYFSKTTVVGLPYKLTIIYRKNAATDNSQIRAGATNTSSESGIFALTSATWATSTFSFIATTTTTFISVIEDGMNNNAELWIDAVKLEPVALNETIVSAELSIEDGVIDIDVTVPTTADGQGGFVIALDDKTTPANFVWGFYNRLIGKVEVYKLVAGVGTQLINVTTAYSAGATLQPEVVKSGSDLLIDVIYNSNTIGTQQVVSSNGYTRHGIMSVDSSNSLDNFEVNP